MEATVKKMRVTPTMAKRWLQNNKCGRPLRVRHVDFLADAIRNDRYKLTGDTIKLNGEALIDGQHRCTAIVQTGRPVHTFVAVGVDEDAYDAIDQGAIRTLSDVLHYQGESYYADLSVAIRTLHCVLNRNKGWESMRLRVSNSEGIEILKSNPGLRTSVKDLSAWGMKSIWSVGRAAGLHYHFRRYAKASDASDEFWRGVATGEMLSKTSPIYYLRERLLRYRNSAEVLPWTALLVLSVKCWNAWRSGEEAVRNYRITVDRGEPIPDPLS